MLPSSQRFAVHAHPAPWRVLGVELRPYCAGHALLLHRVRSPFVTLGATTITLPDIVTAVWICSQPYEAAAARIHRGLSLRWGWFGWRCKIEGCIRPLTTLQRASILAEYMAEHRQLPPIWLGERGRQPGSSEEAMLHARLMADHGYTSSEAWNLPLCQAYEEMAALRESRQQIEVMNDTERAATERANAPREGEAPPNPDIAPSPAQPSSSFPS